MNLNLEAKTAVVTGASRGIGFATVQTLLREGARVIAAARVATPELEASGAVVVATDLSTPSGGRHLVETAIAKFGGIDLLVNNVGGGTGSFAFLDMDDDEWWQVFSLNLMSAVRTTRAALPSLLGRRGSIVNVSSTAARLPAIAPASYSTSKAALSALGKALAEEFGPQGVRVNTVSPGLVRTSVYDAQGPAGAAAASAGISVEELMGSLVTNQKITTGRMSEADEVAGVIAFLLSDRAANITGSDYVIDGGGLKTV